MDATNWRSSSCCRDVVPWRLHPVLDFILVELCVCGTCELHGLLPTSLPSLLLLCAAGCHVILGSTKSRLPQEVVTRDVMLDRCGTAIDAAQGDSQRHMDTVKSNTFV
jgi:hypothetical protein